MAENGPATAAATSSWAKRRAGDAAAEAVITLAQPRPGTARRINEYTETPFKAARGTSSPSPPAGGKDGGADSPAVVTAQPSRTKKSTGKSPPDSESSDGGDDHGSRQRLQQEESIICRRCCRCRCDACRTPKTLPSRWICHDKFLCSGQAVVDYVSCMCCVRGLFYHCNCVQDDADTSCSDQPCSCAPDHWYLRWGSMGLLSLCLPCLCCYPLLRGCLGATERVYGQLTSHGCRCTPATQHSNGTLKSNVQRTDKRLLRVPDC